MRKDAKTKSDNLLTRINHSIRAYNFLGLAFAVIFFCLSQFPSVLPRSWFFQGVIAGVALAIGYGLGTFVSFMIRWLFERDVLVHHKNRAWNMLYVVGGVLILTFLVLGDIWQNQVRKLVEVQPLEHQYVILILILAIATGIACIKLGRSIRKLYQRVLKKIDRLMPRRISIALSFTIVSLFVVWVVTGAFLNFLGTVSSLVYDYKNRSTPEGITRPTEATRSGSKYSQIAWDTLGYQGKKFVATGPSQSQLKDFSGEQPEQPVRVYVGVNSAPDAYERAKLAVTEAKRMGAFKREVLVIAIPTGTGWLNSQSVDALEYMHGGDTAIVAQQYSYLPSWISFLVDKQRAQDAGRALYDAVYDEWASMPQSERPKLLMYGLSLGAFGGHAAFSGPNDMVNGADGVLWQGTPGDTELWKEVTSRRDVGSPEWRPIIDGGQNIRFASTNSDITKEDPEWSNKKVLYMQHGSDPIVWFNFDLPLHKPDWVSEERAPDVMQNTLWVPFVTFVQLAADQVVGMNVPRSYGHNYETTVAEAWAAISAPEDWTNEKTTKLQSIIDTY